MLLCNITCSGFEKLKIAMCTTWIFIVVYYYVVQSISVFAFEFVYVRDFKTQTRFSYVVENSTSKWVDDESVDYICK